MYPLVALPYDYTNLTLWEWNIERSEKKHHWQIKLYTNTFVVITCICCSSICLYVNVVLIGWILMAYSCHKVWNFTFNIILSRHNQLWSTDNVGTINSCKEASWRTGAIIPSRESFGSQTERHARPLSVNIRDTKHRMRQYYVLHR